MTFGERLQNLITVKKQAKIFTFSILYNKIL